MDSMESMDRKIESKELWKKTPTKPRKGENSEKHDLPGANY